MKVSFNYERLDDQTRKTMREQTKAIHGLLEQSTAAAMEIGRRLHAVREILGPTHFWLWVRAEFRWSRAVASKYMSIADKFGEVEAAKHIQQSGLYLLARQKTAPEAIDEALARAGEGESLTRKDVLQIVEKHAPGPRPDIRPQTMDRFRYAVKQIMLEWPAEKRDRLAQSMVKLVYEIMNEVNGVSETEKNEDALSIGLAIEGRRSRSGKAAEPAAVA